MRIDDLRRYSRYYSNAAYMGVDRIFRGYFGLPIDYPVPLSLAHGVDFGHTFYPLDVKSREPIHWSCNAEVHAAAQAYKPSLLLPHPWVMATDQRTLPDGEGTLIIGPPPGPVNDEALFRLIEGKINKPAILIKARGEIDGSIQFWRDRGVTPVTAGAPNDGFYDRLITLLASHRTIVGPTFSSALIFAAAIGRDIQIVRGFTHRTLEGRDYENEVNWVSSRAQKIVRLFIGADQAEIQRTARHLLGADLEFDRRAKIAELEEVVGALSSPFWMDPDIRMPPAFFRRALAMASGKIGFLNAGVGAYLNRARRTHLAIMIVNEFDVWLNGKSSSNFVLEPIVADGTKAVAGRAAEGYGQ